MCFLHEYIRTIEYHWLKGNEIANYTYQTFYTMTTPAGNIGIKYLVEVIENI